ncbi:MAG: hypothetical protein ACYS1A_17715 [Planctomycetota bacterium]|jgi:hypothetical protein
MAKKAKKKNNKTSCGQENKQDIKRTSTGQFKKGYSGNPNGSNGHWRSELERAIKTVERRKRKKFMIHAVEQAYVENTVLVAILKKLLPDLRKQDVDAGANLKNFIDWLVSRDGNSKN